MSREIDRRDFTVNRLSDARTRELSSLAIGVSDGIPGEHRVNIGAYDAVTGNAEVVTSESAPEEQGNYVARALDHVGSIGRALGLAETQPAEFVADPSYQQSSSGAVAVHLQQKYKGISIFQATETVRFSPNGALKETIGSTISVPQELDVTPSVNANEAVMIAAKHVATPDEDELGAVDEYGQALNYPCVDVSEFEPT
ncbi:MAG: hypothetical protein IH991_02430, partial [Planctomycetes bacterium]|nr:hypothetical protein [Planctomycetota bacterium]